MFFPPTLCTERTAYDPSAASLRPCHPGLRAVQQALQQVGGAQAVLIGDDYETPVTYWMPFIGELGIGFHDASWRSSFGGDIYKNSGSHGCVNLPVSAAEQLFNIVYDGMPVICYY